ncbi:MAG: D-Ala-D-Ala carboxypeptidase family metallohydrolase [Rhizobiaceae bacterium]|nr:D-Ala-D-Ala carboxypeptidase family metallohydrolase [Rhizobiaceae bacterium]
MKSLVMGIALFGLSGCISAVTPSAQLTSSATDQTSQLVESDLELGSDSSTQQLLAEDENGNVIAIPVPKPHIATPVETAEFVQDQPTGNIPVNGTQVTTPSHQPIVAPEPLKEVAVVQQPASEAPPPHQPTPVKTAQSSTTKPKITSTPLVGTQIDKSEESQTTELALVVPQENPRTPTQRGQSGELTPLTPQTIASQQATKKQATAALKKPSFLASLFKRPPANVGGNNWTRDDRDDSVSSARSGRASLRVRPTTSSLVAMPGVKTNDEIFGIKKPKRNVQVASAVGLARLSPKGIRVQHSGVNVSCIRPGVVKILRTVERRYGKKPIVTSGYRSPSRNRKAGGARNSLHISCSAVDIQVEGISKWNLAKFLRSIPGRGGVGTYCRTKSVHVDTGSKRDWNQRCRRKSKRRNKA